VIKNVAVILSGGAGSRLWPLSRLDEPKQFQIFTDDLSLLSHTVKRADALLDIDEIVVVCSSAHQSLAQYHTQSHTLKQTSYLLEPVARNTAAAIACAAIYLQNQYPTEDVCMVVMPSDHHISKVDLFQVAVQQALSGARSGHLVTFGVVATKPETGFGYIEIGDPIEGQAVQRVVQFIEKPTLERAKVMLDTGNYRWNSGMFVMQTSLFLDELESHYPDIVLACKAAVDRSTRQQALIKLAIEPFTQCPNISADHAVFERSNKVAAVSLNAGWTDLGSWSAVADIQESQATANSAKAVISVNAYQNYIHSHRTVAIVGLSDIVVVDTADALLISNRGSTQDVKEVVTVLNKQNSLLTNAHVRVRRPWGTYESIGNGPDHQVKHIVVQPGGRLSLQSHQHRAEHWVVVEGIATITLSEAISTYQVGQHVYIPKGQKHRLENYAPIPLAIIEVQIGNYLGEDDIQRYDDIYGRVDGFAPAPSTIAT
jgi:mannose-1-phosphate guanylyltransferase/mannose-6-phosphate isomerase